ncbi:MAG TPA: universal stress protein [Chloroflexota bacterium]|nr:universal stress protein [Chloroflexota bacterium]
MSETRSAYSTEHQIIETGPRPPIIVVPLDGTTEAKAVLPVARLAAQLVRGNVHVVHVGDEPLSKAALLAHVGLRGAETHGLVIDQLGGAVASAIVSYADQVHATLIAMTTRGKTAYQGRTVRPVVEAVISTAHCPVLLVRPEIAPRVAVMTTLHRILLPLDGAPSSAAVIRPALSLAEQSGAAVDVLYVATEAPRPSEPGTLAGPVYVDQPQYEWPSWSEEFVSRFGTCFGERPLPVPTRLFVRHGDPAVAILQVTAEEKSDLIVLEWRGRLDPPHGWVVKRVLESAPCPVLLIRTMSLLGPGPSLLTIAPH